MKRKVFSVSWAPSLARLVGSGLLLVACGATPGSQPDDMSAAHHRQVAAEEDRKAAEHDSHYDPSEQIMTTPAGTDAQGNIIYAPGMYNPTEGHRNLAADHKKHAEDHRAAAEFLEKSEEQACKAFPPETRTACPLLGHLESVQDIDGGVRVRFAEGVNLEAATAHMGCHLAHARTQGYQGMDSCPLYIKGVGAKRVGDTRDVDLTVDDKASVGELRARAAAHVTPK